MPAPGETLVVGLSGGPDSVALLDALAALGRRDGFRVVAAHLDHGLRPDSAADAAFCSELSQRLGVPLRTAVADVRARARRERGGLEQAARRARYEFLRAVRADLGASAIAVAHTRDDQAETLLLRLLRGAGRDGLSAMRPRSGDIVRPLLAVARASVLAHLTLRGLPWRQDPTNCDLNLLRNRVRHELLPYLEAHFNPRLREALSRTAALLADEAELLHGLGDALFARAARCDAGGVVLDRRCLVEAPRGIARMALRRALELAGGLRGVGALHVEQVLSVARSKAIRRRRLQLPGAREAVFGRDEIRVTGRTPVVTYAGAAALATHGVIPERRPDEVRTW